jgi:hypothetical protein
LICVIVGFAEAWWHGGSRVGKTVMSSGEMAYLVLVLGGFCVLSVALGWYSQQQSRPDRRVRAARPREAASSRAVAAH